MDEGNVKKNVDTTKNLTPFTPTRQPTPEQKKAGWDRRRRANEIMNLVDKYSKLSYGELKELMNNIEKNPSNYTVDDVRILQYTIKTIKRDNMIVDFLDRHIPKAPTTLALDEDSEPLTEVIVKIVQNENRNASDNSVSKDSRGSEEVSDNT